MVPSLAVELALLALSGAGAFASALLDEDSRSARYVVTGGAGFIGSHLVEALLARGHRVLAVDDLSAGALANLATVEGHPGFRFEEADITHAHVLEGFARDADVLIHLAAAVGVRRILDHPRETIRANLEGVERALEAASKHRVRLLLASSSEVYGKSVRAPFREDDDVVLGATSKSRWSYGAAKMVGEFLALAYHQQAGVDATILRFFNTIGPRQTGRYGMVAPRFARQALLGEPITVYGDGLQTRCFCDVRDVVEAVAEVAERPEISGEVINVGCEREISILELAELVRELSGSDSPIVRVPYDAVYESGFEDIRRRLPDTSKLRALTAWAPRYSLEETLQSLLEYEGATAPVTPAVAAGR